MMKLIYIRNFQLDLKLQFNSFYEYCVQDCIVLSREYETGSIVLIDKRWMPLDVSCGLMDINSNVFCTLEKSMPMN